MQNQDDDFPYTSDDPSLAPQEDKNAVLSLTSQQLMISKEHFGWLLVLP